MTATTQKAVLGGRGDGRRGPAWPGSRSVGRSFWPWAGAAVLLGAGTAMVYPTLLAAIGDVAHPTWRARSVGIYRLWRDGGFAVGALLAGAIADLWGIRPAIWTVAALTAGSGLLVAARMYETLRPPVSAADPAPAPAPAPSPVATEAPDA